MNKITVGTTFSGIGAYEQALKNIGIAHKVKWACDFDKYARKTYEANFSFDVWYSDIRNIDLEKLEKVDLYCFSAPCTDVSASGLKNLSLGRTTLFENALNIVDAIKPKYVVFENVTGLLTKKFKPYFDYICSRFDENYNYEYKVLNSKDFWLPHYRRRVFFVAIRKDIEQEIKVPEFKQSIFADDCYVCEDCGEPYCRDCDMHYCSCCCHGPNSENVLSNVLEENPPEYCFLSEKAIARLDKINERAKSRGLGYSDCILDPNKDVYKNLDASFFKGCDGKRGVINDNGRLRMPSVRECVRLQGFPDNFNMPISNTQAYKQLGNSISVPVLEEIFKKLLT